jgi:hypothetical protein
MMVRLGLVSSVALLFHAYHGRPNPVTRLLVAAGVLAGLDGCAGAPPESSRGWTAARVCHRLSLVETGSRPAHYSPPVRLCHHSGMRALVRAAPCPHGAG